MYNIGVKTIMEINKIYNEDCLSTMARMPDGFVDLTVTSPPYSDIRNYNGFILDWKMVAESLYRVTKDKGVVVWVVGDKSINGSEELIPFEQGLYFRGLGFCVETMIYAKSNYPFPANVRYNQQFEFMFVFSKGIPKTFNPIKEPKSEKEIKKLTGKQNYIRLKTFRKKDGSTIRSDTDVRMIERIKNAGRNLEKTKGNVWIYPSGYMVSTKDKEAFKHPAIFPERLANDHIISWSNEGDLIYDPFMGSGTTAKMALLNNRNYIGSEVSKEYCDIAEKRIEKQVKLKEI
jgi:site-specific DNA-methyltransferase (adenine-specific)